MEAHESAKPLDRPVDAIEGGIELLQEVAHVALDKHDQQVLLGSDVIVE